MTYLTPADRGVIDIVHARAQFFLWEQRHRRGNDDWFTIGDVFAIFEQRPPLTPFVLALKELAQTGSIEANVEGQVRHV
jgi:hypothetical protein